jgi:hypothetical protein
MTAKEEHSQKLKEAFAILTQGVEMVHYDCMHAKVITSMRMKKIVWMDADILRLCVDVTRPTLADRGKGKVPPGLYMRDISEVRKGSDSCDFQKNPSGVPEHDEHCLSLIATERTISLELPSKFARDWFFERLNLIADDILTEDEKEERRARKIHNNAQLNEQEKEAAQHLVGVLARGVQVLHHHPCGRIVRSVLSCEEGSTKLVIETTERTFFGFYVAKPLSLQMEDVVEVRPGTHSFGFVGTKSTDKYDECLSIIGTECVIDLQFSNQTARDIFSTKLRTLLLHKSAINPRRAANM